jgi:ABC-type oligopeptide transport system substrate-binding subunit
VAARRGCAPAPALSSPPAPRHRAVLPPGAGSADTFIGKLTCNYFTSGNGQATTDASEFCDPAFDRQTARAAALQSTDPPAAAGLWARLDRQLTSLGIWLPTVTPNETDLISARVGNYQYNPVWGALIDQLQIR